jgi:hypothetical protein
MPLSLSQTQSDWPEATNRLNLLLDVRALLADLIQADRTFPIASLARSRDHSASPSAQCPAAEISEATDLRQHRSADIRRTAWLGAQRAERLGDRETGNRNPVAPRGFSFVPAMEVKIAGGRPKLSADVRTLIRDISLANPLWGAPRIHGELLKLGITIGQTTVAKYMARHRRPPSQGWKTFLRNHADGIASMDLFVVPTISFQLLYGLLILKHGRREILCLAATAHPSAEWISRQLMEGLWLGRGATLSDPRSGQGLWRGLHPAPSCDGYSGSADRAAVTMAEWLL